MSGQPKKSAYRRATLRESRRDRQQWLNELRERGALKLLATGTIFAALAYAILMMRESTVPYRPGQYALHNIVARVDFTTRDDNKLVAERRRAREAQPRIYRPADVDPWVGVEEFLLSLPDRVANSKLGELPPDLQSVLDEATLAELQGFQPKPQRTGYEDWVRNYLKSVRALGLVILPSDQRSEDLQRTILIPTSSSTLPIRTETTYALDMRDEMSNRLSRFAQENFPLRLQGKIVEFTINRLAPTHALDSNATAEARNVAEELVPASAGVVAYKANVQLVSRGSEIRHEEWQLLQAEHHAFLASLTPLQIWFSRAGMLGTVLVLTAVLAAYTARFQLRILRNNARAIGLSVLLLSMLLVAQLTSLGTSPKYVFGIAPTLLVAVILSIAYDQRFAIGTAMIHAVFVSIALSAGVGFLLVLTAGVVTVCLLLDDVRSRSKLIEVGGIAALAMIIATAASGALGFDPPSYIARNCFFAGAAGLGVGFVALGILPFIERTFKITTSMSLLELADASHPLLRRLALEAPGTYNHSIQVATLSEEAAEAIGANSLLCRVASYYHDIGKIRKPEYFVENQSDGRNRHLNLTPSVSLLIIVGHVKDGVELAREYGLPTLIVTFIQQHHGTTLVEYFYQRAVTKHDEKQDPTLPAVEQEQFRYPGPRPRTREVAIVMLADAVESACRAMSEPNPARIEALVHDISMRRLLDGQFDECDLTMRDIEGIERSLTKSLTGIYHGRIAYPSTTPSTQTQPDAQTRTA